jgi:dGTPase
MRGQSLATCCSTLMVRPSLMKWRISKANASARYINAVSLSPADGTLTIEPEMEKEVFMWKQLIWYYVILNPALATQQFGQQKIIRDLFQMFLEAATTQKNLSIFPHSCRENVANADGSATLVRLIADLIAGLTERQAIKLHRRLTGVSLGLVLDHIDFG